MNKIIRYFSLLLIVFVLFGCNDIKTKEPTQEDTTPTNHKHIYTRCHNVFCT